MAFDLNGYLRDPSIPAEKKVAGLMSKGSSRIAAEMMVRLGNKSIPEGLYEKLYRDPARWAMERGIAGPIGQIETARNLLAPEDLQGAGETIGALLPGGGFRRGVQTELAGTLAGKAQGRGYGEAALRSAPGAISAALLPWAVRKMMASAIEHGMSQKVSQTIASGAQKLFSPYFPEKVPADPAGLGNFFAKEGPAVENAGVRLDGLRDRLKKQPAFQRMQIPVPVKVVDPVTGMVKYGRAIKPIDEAIDYQMQLSGRGYTMKGIPRGGIVAEPDRQMATMTRESILRQLRGLPRGAGIADQYDQLSRDYGVAHTMGDIVTPQTVKGGEMDHPTIYNNAFNPQNSVHMKNLVGPDKTRQFLSDIAPGRQVVEAQPDSRLGLRPHPLPVHASVETPNAPKAPLNFTPIWAQQRMLAPVGAGSASSQIEGPGSIDDVIKGIFSGDE